jgi:hypothetical protein
MKRKLPDGVLSLPSVERAYAALVLCTTTSEVANIRAVAQAVATRERGKAIGRQWRRR